MGISKKTYAILGIRVPHVELPVTPGRDMAGSGRIGRAATANAGGTLLAMVAAVCGPWSLISGVRGRCFLFVPSERMVLAGGISAVAVTLVDWVGRLLISPGS